MISVDLLIEDCRFYYDGSLVEGCIGIGGGLIVFLGRKPTAPTAEHKLNLKGMIVLPGAIDIHVHIFSPGWIKETFETGSMAAAVGGYTLIADMSSVGEWKTTSLKIFREKIKAGESSSIVDFCLYCGEINSIEDLVEIPRLLDEGAVGLGEIMMCEPDPIPDSYTLLKAMEVVSNANAVIAVHAEDRSLIKQAVKPPSKSYESFSICRPPLAEEKAIVEASILARKAGCKVHICHVSSRQGVRAITLSKKIYKKVSAEVTPHHLLLSTKDYEKLGPLIIATPPVRGKEDCKALWKALSCGLIDVFATDHCAFSKRDKEKAEEPLDVPAGIPGLEVALALLWSEGVRKGLISLERYVEATSQEPSRILGLYPKYGCISIGSVANLTVIDPKVSWKISSEDLYCVSDYTPYEGVEVEGRPVMTIVRGQRVATYGRPACKPGWGRFVRPIRLIGTETESRDNTTL